MTEVFRLESSGSNYRENTKNELVKFGKKHIYLKMMRPIYSHPVAMREGDTGILPDHKSMGLVKIRLGQ